MLQEEASWVAIKLFFSTGKEQNRAPAICSSKDQYNISPLACIVNSTTFLVILTRPPSISFLKYAFESRVQKQSTCSLSYHCGMKAKPEVFTVQCWQGPILITVFRKSFQHHKNASSEAKKNLSLSFPDCQQLPFPKQFHHFKQETSSKPEASLEHKLLHIRIRGRKTL